MASVASRGERLPRWAGPLLIVACPLILLHGFWLGGQLTGQHVDLLSFWLPRWCFMGSSLADGHVPTWLPHQFGGVPFASDPQSGWLYAPVMLLFSTLSCTRALGVMIALNPVLAGLGLYLFLRHEGVGRPAATVGGLTLGLTMAGSVVALSMPFSGTLAWTAVALAGASGFLHARGTMGRLAWAGCTAFALSQVASAHLTHGLLIAALALVPYVLARSIAQVRTGHRSAWSAVGLALGLFGAFPVLAAAVLVPRLALLPRTSIGHGYVELERLTAELSGPTAHSMLAERGVSPWWGTSFARGPGGYVGAVAILLLPVALSSRRWRLPAAAFALAGGIGLVLNLDWLVGSDAIREFALRFRVGELWLRDPVRFRYLLILAFAALAGYGLQAWLEQARASGREAMVGRSGWLAVPVAVFMLLPLVAGSPLRPYALFIMGAAVVAPLLLVVSRGHGWAIIALPIVVALELTAAGLIPLIGGAASSTPATTSASAFGHSFAQLRKPNVEPDDYLMPGPIGRALIAARGEHGRYLTYDRDTARRWRAFLTDQSPATWPAYENGRSVLFGIDEVQGYSPVQVDRYWRLVRAVNITPIFFNAAAFQTLRPGVLDLFGVRWLITQVGVPRPQGLTAVAEEGGYRLFELDDALPRASVMFRWRQVPASEALEAVLRPGFDPEAEVILEREPALDAELLAARPYASGSALYDEISPSHPRVHVTTDTPGILVLRNAFDDNWRATVDGRPAQLLRADYLMQAVALPAGEHTVELTYRDDAIGYGLAVSGVGWAALLAALGWLALRRRRSNAVPSAPASTSSDPSAP